MKFTLYTEISPPGSFGVPEPGYTVVPAPGTYTGPTILTSSGIKVGHGSLSKYRDDDEAIVEELALNGIVGRLRDNFLEIHVESDTPSHALRTASAALDDFLRHLTLAQGRPFSFEVLRMETEDGERVPLPRWTDLGSTTMYHLDALREHIRAAQGFVGRADERLARALEYFDHAAFLIANQRAIVGDPDSRHNDFLVAAIFLNLWKAVTAIVGDPRERDYQSRYKTLGLDYDFFKNKIERLKTLRDGYDVAHHHLSPERVKEVQQHYGEAQQIAREVIERYRQRLPEPQSVLSIEHESGGE